MDIAQQAVYAISHNFCSSSTSSNLGIVTTETIAEQHSTTGTKLSLMKQQPFSISIVHLKSSHYAGSVDALSYLTSSRRMNFVRQG